MKASTIFWATALICLGAMILIENFTDGMNFAFMVDWWPLLPIIWGVNLLKIPYDIKKALAALSAVTLIFIAFGLFHLGRDAIFPFKNISVNVKDININSTDAAKHRIKYDSSYKVANFIFEGGAGEFSIGGETEDLIMVAAPEGFGALSFDSGDNGQASLIFRSDQKTEVNVSDMEKYDREAHISLHSAPAWNIVFEAGASNFECDLSSYNVRNVYLKIGAANVELDLGSISDTLDVKVETGAADFEINIPKESGCRIHKNIGLAGYEFEDFLDKGDGVFETPNFNSAKKKIFINLKGGLANFEVNRK